MHRQPLRLHRLIAAFALGVVACLPAGAKAGVELDDNQVPLPALNSGDVQIFSDAGVEVQNQEPPSMLALGTSDNVEFCSDADSGVCAGNKNLWFYAHLPVCDTKVTIDCVSSFSATTSDGTIHDGVFQRYYPATNSTSFVGKQSIGLPSGSSPGLWSIPSVPHQGGSDYIVIVRLDGGTDDVEGYSFRAAVIPVSYKADADTSNSYQMPRWTQPGRLSGPNADRGKYRCAIWGEGGSCMLSRSFPEGTKFSITARLSHEPTGWLHGRMANPEISFANLDNGVNVSISASPVQVPAFSVVRQLSSYPQDIQSSFGPGTKYGSGKDGGGTVFNVAANSEISFEQFAKVSQTINDTASYAPWVWSVRTLSAYEMRQAGPCLTKGTGVKGIVSTNATIYGSGPPDFDAASRTMNYKVAAPHYWKDGTTPFKGAYNLQIRTDVAECLYRFSKMFAGPSAPDEFTADGSADEYVVEEPYTSETRYARAFPKFGQNFVPTTDGSYQIFETPETESITLPAYRAELLDFSLTEDKSKSGLTIDEEEPFEDSIVASADATVTDSLKKTASADTTISFSDGWFRFSAEGFTFSDPTIGVSLVVTPSRIMACISGAIVTFVKSIATQCMKGYSQARSVYCIKNIGVSVVVGLNPVCPRTHQKAEILVCAKGPKAVMIASVTPRCPAKYATVNNYYCVKGTDARKVSAVRIQCKNGFQRATQLICTKGQLTATIVGVNPFCPAGYRRKN